MRTIQWLLAGLLLAFGGLAAAAELVEPAPIDIPAQIDPQKTVKAIKNAMARDKWVVDKEEPGRIVASFSPRDHVARVSIVYDDKQIRIGYLDSVNLNFEERDGRREIHANYNKWIKRLAGDIAAFDTSDVPLLDSGERRNPPPSEMLSAFSHFEMGELTVSPPYAGQSANEHAAAKIQENLDRRFGELFNRWNDATKPDKPRSLRVEANIQSITFISGGARFFVGAMAGSSDVVLQLKFIDVDNGQLVASPRFHRHSAASRGFMGISDNEMLNSVAELAAEYAEDNYSSLAGGRIGDPF